MDIEDLDNVDLAEAVRRGEVHPRELVEAALHRANTLNGDINALVVRLDEQALEAAADVDTRLPFPGLPFLVKESAALAGTPCSSASELLKDRRTSESSELMRRYLAAGLIPIGKTNLPEFGILGTTEPRRFGPARNPWNPRHSTGGSSGGSAAAVAAGIVPVAHGGDSGGSLRIPASCCGVVSMKPSRHRTPIGPGHDVAGLSAEHVITRSVRDNAAALDVTAGPYAGMGTFPRLDQSFREAAEADPASLAIGFSTTSPLGFPVHPDCADAVQKTAELCAELGHRVEEASPAFAADLFSSFDAIWVCQLAAWIDVLIGDAGEPPAGSVEPLTRAIWELGRQRSVASFQKGLAGAQLAAAAADRFHDSFGIWLTPTVASPPVPLGWMDQPADDPLRAYRRDAEFCAFTPIANMTGQPAMSLPLHWNSAGLPVGIQLTARFGDEATLFRLSGQLERAQPWRGRRALAR